MEMSMTPAWIVFMIGIATTVYNIWKSGFSVNKELNKKLDTSSPSELNSLRKELRALNKRISAETAEDPFDTWPDSDFYGDEGEK